MNKITQVIRFVIVAIVVAMLAFALANDANAKTKRIHNIESYPPPGTTETAPVSPTATIEPPYETPVCLSCLPGQYGTPDGKNR